MPDGRRRAGALERARRRHRRRGRRHAHRHHRRRHRHDAAVVLRRRLPLPAGLPEGHPARARTARSSWRARSRRPAAAARMRTAFDPDGSEHGTHVAGIAAGLSGITGDVARRDDHQPLRRRAARLPRLLPRAHDADARRSASTATAPRSRAPSTGPWPTAWTCSTSRSASPRSSPSNDVVARAIHGAARAGVVTVVAAGNSGDDLGGGSISSPGSAPGRDHGRRDERRALRRRHARRARPRRRAGRPRPRSAPPPTRPTRFPPPGRPACRWSSAATAEAVAPARSCSCSSSAHCTAARADSAARRGRARHRLRPARSGRPGRDRRQPAALADRLRPDRRAPRPAGRGRGRRALALARRRSRASRSRPTPG